MGFYEDFIEKYDSLVSFDNRVKREGKFFKDLFSKHGVKTILDCACGTGHHVIMLNQLGFATKGSDLSKAMIEKAHKNANKNHVKAVFKTADFRTLTKSFNEKFDALLCVGNSLPHLASDADLIKALTQMHKLLEKDGILILEQRNYDLLLSSKKRFFPVSFRKNEVFFYVLDYETDSIKFNVLDLDTKNQKFEVYSTKYSPLKKSRLVGLLNKVGFSVMATYSDYQGNPFDIRKSWNLLLICRR